MKRALSVLLLVLAAFSVLLIPFALAETAASAEPARRIDLTQILLAVLSLLASIITRFLVPWVKSRTTESDQKILESTARIAVFAAEQLYGALKGDMKLKFAKAYLQRHGWDVDTDEVKTTIEAMVQELTLKQVPAEPAFPELVQE